MKGRDNYNEHQNSEGESEWETHEVVFIATGDVHQDRLLATKARALGKRVFLPNLPQESDAKFQFEEANSIEDQRNNTNDIPTKLSFNDILKRIAKGSANKRSNKQIAINIFAGLALMIIGHVIFSYLTIDRMSTIWDQLILNEDFIYYVIGGFLAQMIDGALGMAYGVTSATFLLTLGVPPSAVSASVHTSEIFTSGVSGYMHLKFGNVNSKLFKKILIPGVIGAITGAYLLSSLEKYIYIIKPVVAAYTLILGILIIQKALKKRIEKRPIRKIGWLAMAGGTLDSIGGGGWGPIVTSTLIARGRHPKYTIGSVNLAEFFVSLASSITFITLIGFSHWQVILGLILGGMVAAPIAANLSRRLPIKTMMIMVGTIVIIVSLRIIYMVLSNL